jgi:hypothetical protein
MQADFEFGDVRGKTFVGFLFDIFIFLFEFVLQDMGCGSA